MDFEASIRLADVITWLMAVFLFVSTYTKLSTKVADHSKIIHKQDGDLNVVTWPALERSQTTCRAGVDMKCEAMTERIKRSNDSICSRIDRTDKELLDLKVDHKAKVKTDAHIHAEHRTCLTQLNTKIEGPCVVS